MDIAVTKDDLRDLRDVLTEQIREGFDGVHRRQDITNGRVNKSEVAIGQLEMRMKNTERELFHRRRDDRSRPPSRQPSGSRAITRRELRIVTAVIAGEGAILLFILKILPAIARVLP